MTSKAVCAAVLALGLSGCTAAGSLGGAVTDVSSQIDQLLPQLIMEKAVALHNLQVGLQQVNATPGMVTTVPMVGTTAPVTTPIVPANPVSPPTVPSPALPVTPPTTAPTGTTIPPTPVIQ
jgi:hypothetical protein